MSHTKIGRCLLFDKRPSRAGEGGDGTNVCTVNVMSSVIDITIITVHEM